VYSLFSEGDDKTEWRQRLADVSHVMKEINRSFFEDDALRQDADIFVDERIDGALHCLADVEYR
jgi:aspartate kinase